jgi:orotate phosphoribosyltransferase-like protein
MPRFERTEDSALTDTEALKLRSQGLTYQDIADQQGCDVSTAYRRCKRALGAIPESVASEMRALEGERLDALQYAIWEKAMSGDLRAVSSVLGIMQRRARLYGLDIADQPAQERYEPFTLDAVQREIARLERELAKQ